MSRVPVIVAFAMVIFSGLVHALWKERGQSAAALEEAAARVQLVPLQIGNWKGKELKVEPEDFARAGALAYWMRHYAHRGRSITVLLMCGRAGKMSVHTPEFCYQGLGYQMVDAAANVTVAHEPALTPTPLPRRGEKDEMHSDERGRGVGVNEFWTARFTKQLGGAVDLRLFWGWNAGHGWRAPSSPRWDFRGQPFLFKLYVVHETSPGQRLENEPAFEFLKQALREMDKALFPDPSVTERNEVPR
jgi:hypothetical protein